MNSSAPLDVWDGCPRTRYEAHYGARVVRCFSERPDNLDAMLRQTVEKYGRREALIEGERRYTYSDLDEMADRVASGLRSAGVETGDRVALLLNNRAEFVFALFGAIRAGCVVVPLNTREQKPELEHVLSNSGAKVLFHEVGLVDRLPANDAVSLHMRVSVGGDTPGSTPFQALISKKEFLRGVIPQEATAVILYTSGTTGKPKGAMLTHLSILTSVMHFQYCWRLTEVDRAAMAVPVTHVTGLVAILLAMIRVGGATIVLPAFKAKDFLEVASRERMSYTLMVPAMYHLCLLQANLADVDLSTWRIGGYGGSPMPVSAIQKLAEVLPNLRLCNAYGSTETTSPSTLMPLDDGIAHAHTVGRPLPCVDICVMDDDGREVAAGETGEIWIKGGNVAAGYWGNKEASADTFIAGYWRSGDIGALTQDGYLQIFDRKKDMINRGGFKVYSAEVEDVLAQHPQVGEAAVVGMADPVLHERVHAYIYLNRAGTSEDDIKAFCAARLSDYKVPDRVTFVAQPLPRNANGKVLKRALLPQAP